MRRIGTLTNESDKPERVEADADAKRHWGDVVEDDYAALLAARHEAHRDYDRAALTVAGGAFGLSMAFVADIVGPTGGPVAAWKLGLAWVAFTISIGALLASMMAAARSHDVALRKIRKNELVGDGPIGGKWTKATFVLNWMGFTTVVIGLALLVWFAVDNFGGLA